MEKNFKKVGYLKNNYYLCNNNKNNKNNKIMKVIIKAIAPTSYQKSSLSHFKFDDILQHNGTYVGVKEFYTLKGAREYLKCIANEYYECDKELIRNNLSKNSLEIDGCVAYIQKSN